VPGLRVRILPSGTRTWSLNIRDSRGVRRRFDIGAGLGLAEARRKAEELRRAVREGADPTTERRVARQRAHAAKMGVGTLGALLESYFVHGPGHEQRRAAGALQHVRTVFGDLLDRPTLDLRRPDLQLAADGWRSAASAALAVRLLRPCLKWAQKRGLLADGVANLEQPGRARKRERVLTNDELKAVWQQLHGTHGNVIKWLLWTGCRLNEAAGMTWGEIDADVWTIPAARAKNKRQRAVPLPQQAVDLLRVLRAKADQEPGVASSTARTVRPQVLVFPSAGGGILSNWGRTTKRLQKESRTAGWHRHDLRRTAATILGDLGFPPHVISVVLGHAHIADGATAVYARSRYQREHREALQALADEIESIVGTNIVRLAV
jgi:integrase